MLNLIEYKHKYLGAKECQLPVGKVVCVGRNYHDHIQELGNTVPSQSILFIKPNTTCVSFYHTIKIPSDQGECHNELELAFLIGKPLHKGDEQGSNEAIAGIGLGLDLTLRDEQSKLKKQGYPWERAKAFDGSCPLSEFVPVNNIDWQNGLNFELFINNERRQSGDSKMMIKSPLSLISEISQHFTLLPGDVVITGTPKGVGPLHHGDTVRATLGTFIDLSTQVEEV